MVRRTTRFVRRAAGQLWSALTWIFRFVGKLVKSLFSKGANLAKSINKNLAKIDAPIDKVAAFLTRRAEWEPRSNWGKSIKTHWGKYVTLKFHVKIFLWLWVIWLALYSFAAMIGSTGEIQLPNIQYPEITGVSRVFTPEVRRWTPWILYWSFKYDVEPNHIATIMQIESCGNPKIPSPAGAQGLFQVMPFHFAEGEDMLDPGTNAFRGLSYFRARLDAAQGDIPTAFATYNGGPAAANPSNRVHETQRYVYWATGILDDIDGGLSESPRLHEWLASGGASLCKRASEIPVFVWEEMRLPERVPTYAVNYDASSETTEIVVGTLEDVEEIIQLVTEAPILSDDAISFLPEHFPRQIVPDACDERGFPLDNYISGYDYSSTHGGVDIKAYVGEPIPSTHSGFVVFADWSYEGYGYLVIVGNTDRNVQTYYAHLSEILVSKDDEIAQGEIVGLGGSTGNSTGPHLHYEVRYDWETINPWSGTAWELTCGEASALQSIDNQQNPNTDQ